MMKNSSRESKRLNERTKGFVLGVIVCLLVLALTGTTLAASGALSIDVYPIKILVNNEVFQPKDVNGNDVMVFTYKGTTYAPLRALAEAYGLVVGYDAASKTATVTDPGKASDSGKTFDPGYVLFESSQKYEYCKTNNKLYSLTGSTNSDTITVSEYNSEYYVEFNPYYYNVYDLDISIYLNKYFVLGDLIEILSVATGHFSTKAVENPYLNGVLDIDSEHSKLASLGVTEKTTYTGIDTSVSTYTYRYAGKTLSAPEDVVGAMTTVDGVRFVRSSDSKWYVNINDVLDYFGIKKDFSTATIESKPFIVFE